MYFDRIKSGKQLAEAFGVGTSTIYITVYMYIFTVLLFYSFVLYCDFKKIILTYSFKLFLVLCQEIKFFHCYPII